MPRQTMSSGSAPQRRQVFVESRRAKKKETDRICQQRKRKRDRENLERLQQRVDLLQKDRGDILLTELIEERDQNEARNIRHRTRLLQIKGLAEADLADMTFNAGSSMLLKDDHTAIKDVFTAGEGVTMPSQSTVSAAGTDLCISGPIFSSNYSEMPISAFACENEELQDKSNLLIPHISISMAPQLEIPDYQYHSNTNDLQHHSQAAQINPLDHSGVPAGQEIHECANSELWLDIECLLDQSRVSTLEPIHHDNDIELDIHVIITAILRDWARFSKAIQIDTHWSCLRELDEKYFAPNSRDVDRLALLLITSQVQKLEVGNTEPGLEGSVVFYHLRLTFKSPRNYNRPYQPVQIIWTSCHLS